MDLGVRSQGTERKPIWVLCNPEGWDTGFGIQPGIKQRPRRQAEWLRDHILKHLCCQGYAGLERHKVGEEWDLIVVLERSLGKGVRKLRLEVGLPGRRCSQ